MCETCQWQLECTNYSIGLRVEGSLGMSETETRSPGQDNRCLDMSFLTDCNDGIREFFLLWESKCRAGRLPSRSDINPAEMARLLPNIMLIDVIPPGPQFRYRLVGTGEVRHRGIDPTGKTLEEAYSGLDSDYCDGNYRYVATSGKHLFDTSPEPTAKGNLADVQAVFVPLAGDGKTVDTIMVYSVVGMVSGDKLGTVAGRRDQDR